MLLDALADLVDEFSAAPAPMPVQEDPTPRAALAARLDELEKRRARLMDLLEEGIYDTATYTQRMALLRADIAAATAALNEIPQRTQTPQERAAALLPQLRHVLQAYHAAPTAADKNKLLRSVIDHVDYHKTHRCLRGQRAADYVTLDLFLKV